MEMTNGHHTNLQPAVISVKHQEAEEHLLKSVNATTDLIEFDNSLHQDLVLTSLNKLRKGKQFCDVVLLVSSERDTHEVYAHRAVVASVSSALYELFQQKTTGGATNNQCKVPGVYEIDVFERIIDYAYSAKFEIARDKLPALYRTAAKLRVHAVAKFCGRQMVDSLTADNCLGVRAILLESMDQELVNSVDAFIRENIKTVLGSNELGTLPHIQVEMIQATSQEMDATNERHLFELVMDWMRTSCGHLSLDGMTERLHMLYLNLDQTLHDCNDIEEGDCKHSELVQDYKRMAKKHNHHHKGHTGGATGTGSGGGGGVANGKKRNPISNTPVKPKQFLYTRSESSGSSCSSGDEEEGGWRVVATSRMGQYSTMGLVILSGRMVLLSVVRRLNPTTRGSVDEGLSSGDRSKEQSPQNRGGDLRSRTGSPSTTDSLVSDLVTATSYMYTTLPVMAASRCSMGAGDYQGQLVVCGGYDRGECLRSVEILNLKENRWRAFSPMQSPRGRTDIAIIGDRIYAVAGSDGQKELASVEVYKPEVGKWEFIPPLSIARSNPGVCSVDGEVFVAGGWNGQRGMACCDAYNPQQNTWRQVSPMQQGRYQAGVAYAGSEKGGMVYAVGGCETWQCVATVERYDVTNDAWSAVAPLQQARRGCGAVFYNGKLWAIGGHDGVHSLCSVEQYDPATNSWSHGPSLTTCRANVACAIVNGILYAVGGFNGKTFLNTMEYYDESSGEWTIFVPRSRDASVE